MKNALPFLAIIILSHSLSCRSSFRNQITEVHEAVRLKGDVLATQLEALMQQANSIKIQGRALSAGEIKFIQGVDSLREEFNLWNQQMEKAGEMKSGEDRLALEQSLLETIIKLTTRALLLSPK